MRTAWYERCGPAREVIQDHLIAARFPLERLAEAHEAQESGQYVGNIIVDIG
jgi:hypothetical protein